MTKAKRYPNYRESDIGWLRGSPIPLSWPTKRLKHLAQMRSGEGITSDDIEPNGAFPVYGGNGLRGYTPAFTHEGTFPLIGRQGALCGNVHLASGRFWASEHAVVVSPCARADPTWLSYCLAVMDLGQYSVATAQPGLAVGTIENLGIPGPSLDEQRQIAVYLDRETTKIDALIGKQEQLIEALRERRRALFGHVLDRASGPPVRLRYLFRPSSECDAPTDEVLSVYREYGVIPKSSRSDNFNRTPENLERYLLVRPGDLVVNKMKAWQGSLGISNHRGIVSPDYEVLRKTDGRLLAAYAHHLLRSPGKIAEYAVRSVGIRPSQWRLYWDQLGEIRVVLPSEAEQQKIVDYLDEQTAKIDVLIGKAQRFIELSKERRSALISAAVTGQIDVRGEIDDVQTDRREGAA